MDNIAQIRTYRAGDVKASSKAERRNRRQHERSGTRVSADEKAAMQRAGLAALYQRGLALLGAAPSAGTPSPLVGEGARRAGEGSGAPFIQSSPPATDPEGKPFSLRHGRAL